MINEAWLEHHVNSAYVEDAGNEIIIRNWSDVPPQGDGAGAVRWHQLGREGEGEIGCLRGLTFINRIGAARW